MKNADGTPDKSAHPKNNMYQDGTFSIPSMRAPLNVEGSEVTLDFFVDRSSVELFTAEGTMSMTNLVFPTTLYNSFSVTGAACEASYRPLSRIWK